MKTYISSCKAHVILLWVCGMLIIVWSIYTKCAIVGLWLGICMVYWEDIKKVTYQIWPTKNRTNSRYLVSKLPLKYIGPTVVPLLIWVKTLQTNILSLTQFWLLKFGLRVTLMSKEYTKQMPSQRPTIAH